MQVRLPAFISSIYPIFKFLFAISLWLLLISAVFLRSECGIAGSHRFSLFFQMRIWWSEHLYHIWYFSLVTRCLAVRAKTEIGRVQYRLRFLLVFLIMFSGSKSQLRRSDKKKTDLMVCRSPASIGKYIVSSAAGQPCLMLCNVKTFAVVSAGCCLHLEWQVLGKSLTAPNLRDCCLNVTQSCCSLITLERGLKNVMAFMEKANIYSTYQKNINHVDYSFNLPSSCNI